MTNQESMGKTIFLLGGLDLEMVEIQKILESNKIKFVNRNLQWGAKLSAYEDVFDDTHNFVTVELIEDCTPPLNYTQIDHHNEKSHLPSSIEQVAKLLGVELTRFQSLVAVNDRAYIPGMINAGATQAEIENIRKLDREAQGVTENDEKLAEESILKNLSKTGSLTIVESLTSKFSAITDRLFPYAKLLIHYHDHLVYYGIGANVLAKNYKNFIQENKAFSGGGNNGFFGIPAGAFSHEEFNNLKDEIIHQIQKL